MRKVIKWSRYLLLASFLFLYSCKKNADETRVEETNREQKSNPELAGKVTEWLEKQQLLYTDSRSQKIDSLKKALVISRLTVEDYSMGRKLVILPVGGGFQSSNNANKTVATYLVTVLDSGRIVSGNIIQAAPADGRSQLPPSSFSNVFTYRSLSWHGVFSVLTVTDRISYELKFEKGNLRSVAMPEPRRDSTKVRPSGRTNGCTNIDWYWVEISYWSDGSYTVTSTFMYTECVPDTDCAQPRIINGRNFKTNCSNAGGGGEIEYLVEKNKTVIWTVDNSPANDPYPWKIRSTEKIRGFYNQASGGSGHFVYANHELDFLQDASNSFAEWESLSGSATLGNCNSSGQCQSVNCSVKGNVKFPTGVRQPISLNKSRSWSPSQVYNF